MEKKVLILECGKGFGGALTSLKTLLDAVHDQSEFEFYLLTNYEQDLIKQGGRLKQTGVLKRNKLYGPDSALEQFIGRFFPKFSGHLAFLADMVLSGTIYTVRVIWYCIRHGIDIVHLNNSILINDYGILAAFLAGRKAVVQVRAPEYPSKVAKALSGIVHRFLPVSGFVKASLQALGIEEKKISIVPEGIDSERFEQQADNPLPASMPKKKDCPVVGMVGCLVPWKGHGVFLDACKIISENKLSEFYIIGDTPDGDQVYKDFLKEHAATLGILESVHFLGHCSNVAPVIKNCDIIVHASTAPEPFGRVLLEAMILQKPVVATDAGGPAEVIDNGIDGILVPPGNSQRLADAVVTLIQDHLLSAEMGKIAALKVKKQYSAERHTSLVLNAYRSLRNGK